VNVDQCEDHNRRGRLLFEFADADGQAGLA
jgi:hypothetical protein